MTWHYQGKLFESEDIPEGAVGFIYVITNKKTSKKYIGQKRFFRTIVRPPLKGQKKKRRTVVESDWKKYTGSSTAVNAQVAELGLDWFDREILEICSSKGCLNYAELKKQVDLNVLLDDDYLNGIIQVRINRTHLK
jgi:hypothetical protein